MIGQKMMAVHRVTLPNVAGVCTYSTGSTRVKAILKWSNCALLAALAALVPGLLQAAGGDAAVGATQAAACAACHGADGATGIDPSYPNLAGQNERYLFSQLQMIRDKSRDILLMTGQLDGKSDDDLRNLAAHYASLPSKNGQAQGDDTQIDRATAIYRGGIAEKGVAACSACHGPSGTGNALAGYPHIGGQAPVYTIAQLKAYREGHRATDEAYGGMMRGVAGGLTDTEIELLADYLLGLH